MNSLWPQSGGYVSTASIPDDARARLHEAAQSLIQEHSALCGHSPGAPHAVQCLSCAQIEEVLDMVRCCTDSAFEASALCGYFRRELEALLGGGAYQSLPVPDAPWAGLRSS